LYEYIPIILSVVILSINVVSSCAWKSSRFCLSW